MSVVGPLRNISCRNKKFGCWGNSGSATRSQQAHYGIYVNSLRSIPAIFSTIRRLGFRRHIPRGFGGDVTALS